jgi:small multidrug resistance pump
MNTYIFLGGAIVAEVIGTIFMKYSEGFTRLWPSVGTAISYCAAFYLLSQTLENIPTGIAYAIWSGAGIVLISLAGWLVSGQKLDWPAIAGMFLICVGVLVINIFQNLLRINFLPKHIGQSKRISLRSFLSARNLFPCKQKNHRYQRWFVCRNSELPTLCSDGNWLSRSADT